jgi:hypothetical protein
MGSEGNVLGKLSDLSQKYLLAECQTKNKMTFGENSIINASKNDIKLIFNHFFLASNRLRYQTLSKTHT